MFLLSLTEYLYWFITKFLIFYLDPEGLARKKLKVEERIDLERYFQGNVLASSIASGKEFIPCIHMKI